MLALTTKLNEIVHIKDEAVRVQTKLQADLKHQSDVIASLRYDLAVQRRHSQDVQIMLDRANRTLDEKDVQIHKINKEKHEVQLENSELSRSIEILEGKCPHTYVCRPSHTDILRCLSDFLQRKSW